ncbi:hybrid sensor histidine kinase/response regulator [Gemmatimonas phototrophica]|uniref:hybrid sensor histidine kinase/response regulator n=1 Tax=Gemmatimonas phototrophica TaxID=1379270 RepID=UPI0006A6EA62|nr:PAS domain-containing sensor histidine kinase [Gemmatimonas phototrophica]
MNLNFRRIAWPIVAVIFMAAIAAAAALQWRHLASRSELQRVSSSARLASGVRMQVSSAFLLRSRAEGGDASVDTILITGAIQRAQLLLNDWQRGREGSRGVLPVVALPLGSPLRDAVERLAQSVGRFSTLLQQPAAPGTNVRLRSAYADVTALCDSVDLLVARGGSEALQRDDLRNRWSLTILSGTIVLLGLLFGVLWARWNVADREGAEAQRALVESERQLRLLTDQIPVGVFRTASTGEVEFINSTMERMYDAPREQLRGDGWIHFVHPLDRERLQEERTAARLSGVDDAAFMFRICRGSDSAVREVVLRARYLRDAQGHVRTAIGVMEDVTDRRALETQLVQSQKMEAVGRLAGGVAHDFNNLLTVIGGITELLLTDARLPEELRQDLAEVHDASERARTLTRQLLALSRQQRIHVASIPVGDVLTRTTALLRRVLGEHIGVSLQLPESDLTASADGGAIEQMLLNLALNARDAMPSGGTLRLAAAAGTEGPGVVAAHDGAWVVITVQDSGSGISAEVLPHVFEPFFTTKDPGEGTGLGLAMVQSLAAQMRGAVTVESTVGTGSTFRIFLPASAPAPPQVQTPGAGPRGSTTGGVVLLVEDNTPLRHVVARALRDARYTVLEAGDVPEAQQLFEARSGQINVVVTDVVLPGASGPTLVRWLRARCPEVAVLYVTGFSASEQLVRDVDDGTPMLAKPFDMRDLVAAVDQLLAPAT